MPGRLAAVAGLAATMALGLGLGFGNARALDGQSAVGGRGWTTVNGGAASATLAAAERSLAEAVNALDAPAVARDVAALRALVLEEGAGRRLRARQRAQALLRVAFAERVMERPVQASADLAAALAIDPACAADPVAFPPSLRAELERLRDEQARAAAPGTPRSRAQDRHAGRVARERLSSAGKVARTPPRRLQRQRQRRFRRPSRPGPAP